MSTNDSHFPDPSDGRGHTPPHSPEEGQGPVGPVPMAEEVSDAEVPMAEVLPEEELIPLPNSAAPPAGVSGTGLSGAGLPGASPPGGEEAGVPTPGEVSAGEAFAFGDNPVATAELSAAELPIVGAPPEESEVADFVEFVAEAEPLSPAAEDAAFSVLAGEEASPAEPPSGETDDDPFTVVRGVDAGGSSVDFGKPPGKSRASGAAASDEAEVRFVTDFDRERRETEQTSEERILPTIGVDENGDPISASDLEVEPDPGAKRGKKRRKAAPTAAVGPETLVRSGRGRGALWGLAGLLAGAGAFAGVWQAGWLAGDGQKPPPAGPVRPAPVAAAAQAPGVPTPAPVAAPSAADGWRALEVGDAATALAAFEQGDAADPAVLAGRGQARWLSYLQQQARQDKPLAADAEAVQAARGELEQAVARGGASPEAARAQLWLGLIEEVLGNPAKAQEIYRQGAQTYPQQQALFRAGLNRLQALAPAPAPAASWRPAEALLGFTLLAVFQEPGAAPPAPPEATAPGDESGFAFWEALVLARNHRYSEAREALRRARDVHEKQRLLRAGKGLNPLSDPLNQIFGRSCEEIDAAWAVCESLYRLPGAAETVRQKGFPAIAGDAVATLRQAADTLKQASPESRTLPEAIEALVRSRDALARDLEGRDAQLRAVQESLKEAGFDAPKVEDAVAKALAAQTDAADKLRQVRAGLAGAGVKSAEPGEAVAELAATVAAVADRLRTAGFVGEGAGRAVLLRGLDEAVARAKRPAAAEVLPPAQALMTGGASSVAQAMRTGERLRQAQAEVRRLGALVRAERDRFRQRLEAQQARHEKILGQVRTPPEMLDVWLTILENPFRKEEAAAALTDAQRVLDDAQAAPDVRAKALAVKGLALRNRGEFDAARGALAQSQKHAAFAGDQTWGQVVQTAARGLRDPGLVLEAVGTAADGPGAKDRARDLLELGLKMFPAEKFPEEHGRLLARRATFRLAAGETDAALADAREAIRLGAVVEGNYATGKISEKQGDRFGAERSFREVIRHAPPDSEMGRDARLALSRLLLQRDARPAPQQQPAPAAGAVRAAPAGGGAESLTVAVTLLGAQPSAPPAAPAPAEIPESVREAMRLAEELIRQKEPRGHFLKADVLTRLGRYNDALHEFAAGLKHLEGVAPNESAVLDEILARHPALQRPDTSLTPSPGEAERLFRVALDHFFDGECARAEESLLAALRHNDRDARYLYFLGLARWRQGKPEFAEADFRAAAALERQGWPGPRDVTRSLERVQGDLRRLINQYRP